MALPLIPIVAAIASGGNLVAHSAGGLIVYSSATAGYVGGTYISTAALASFFTGTALAAGSVGTAALAGTAVWAYGTVTGAAMSLIGSAGFFGTTIGATGITGMLMSWGLISSTPILIPVLLCLLIVSTLLLAIYYAHRVRKIRGKVLSANEGEEVLFSNAEAKIIQKMILSSAKKHTSFWRKIMMLIGRVKRKI